MGVGNRLVLRTPPASNGPKCTCTVVAVYPVTSAYHARDSTCHAHSLAFVKFEVPFLPIDPYLTVEDGCLSPPGFRQQSSVAEHFLAVEDGFVSLPSILSQSSVHEQF